MYWPVDRVRNRLGNPFTDWRLRADWASGHARSVDPIRPMPNKSNSRHAVLPIALISRLPDWAMQSVLPIAYP